MAYTFKQLSPDVLSTLFSDADGLEVVRVVDPSQLGPEFDGQWGKVFIKDDALTYVISITDYQCLKFMYAWIAPESAMAPASELVETVNARGLLMPTCYYDGVDEDGDGQFMFIHNQMVPDGETVSKEFLLKSFDLFREATRKSLADLWSLLCQQESTSAA